MSAREKILNRLRTATPGTTEQIKGAPVPANALGDTRATLIETFILRAEQSSATVRRVHTTAELDSLLDNYRANEGADCTVVRADVGIAETGTACVHSHQVSSRSLFLCEHLVVVLSDADIRAYQEDYWVSLNDLPRAVHLITGPSRTADVEQTIQIGAHGPKTITLLLGIYG